MIIKHLAIPCEESASQHLEDGDVTLVTHGTLNHLYELLNISDYWKGPMAVTFFLTNDEVSLPLLAILNMKVCNPIIDATVMFNLIIPREFSLRFDQNKVLMENNNSFCNKLFINRMKNEMTRAYKSNNYEHEVAFPVNLARNVGWSSISTSFVFSIDIDFVPNSQLYQDFVKFARTDFEFARYDSMKYIYVVPAFEKKSYLANPRTKKELLNGLSLGEIQPFNGDLCPECHNVTKYEVWENVPLDEEFGVAYRVDYLFRYEPYFIARKDIPKYDERFQQYGSNRLSLVSKFMSTLNHYYFTFDTLLDS